MTRLFDAHGFESKHATKKLLKAIESFNPDIIWLHNLHGYYLNIEILFSYLKRKRIKVKWTLHDCWAFTGHCPYFSFIGCNKWETGCYNCPQYGRYPTVNFIGNAKRNYGRKKNAFCGLNDLEIIVVSHWLEALVKKSFLKEYRITVQHNIVNKSKFYYCESEIASKYHIDGKKIILGVATDWTEYKGLSDYFYLAEHLPDDYQVVLIGMTKKQIRKLPPKVLGLEKTQNIMELVEWYSTAHLNVVASKEETFGMTILEAHCCGTPSIVYKGTACEEVVQLCGEGEAVDQDPVYLYKKILELCGVE